MIYLLEYENEKGDSIEFSFSSGIIISSISGLTENNISLPESQGINQIGSTIISRSIESKSIPISGVLIGDSESKKKQLLDTILPGINGLLIYDKKWTIPVEVANSPYIQSYRKNPKYQIMFKAPFPFWESITPTISPMSGETAYFQFMDLTKNVIFGERFLNPFTIIKNNGNADSFFSLIFHASDYVNNPEIINAETFEFLRLNTSMNSGDEIILSIRHDGVVIIKFNGESIPVDISGSLNLYSNLSRIKPGDNILKIGAESVGWEDVLDATVIHNDITVGVFHENSRI